MARRLTFRGTMLGFGVGWVALLMLWGVWAAVGDSVWDPTMPVERVPAALRKEVDARHTFRCVRQEEAESLALDDVDYFCEPVGADAPGYWVSTDGDEISGTQQTGP